VKKGVGVQMLTVFACVCSYSIVVVAILVTKGLLAFLFMQITPAHQYFLCALHENYTFNKCLINGKNMMYLTMATSTLALPPRPYFDGFFWLP
jgi:hypothetical protein